MGIVRRARRKVPFVVDRARRARKRRRRARIAIEFYRLFVRRDDLCFDVGANIGNRTAIFLKLGARVVAVEPQQACAEQLRQRFGSNGRFTLVKAALGAQPGEAELLQTRFDTIATLSPDWIDSVRSSGRFPFEWDQKTVVPVTTLDALIQEYGRPAFCKIDVEGYEDHVLAGLTQSVSAVSFEVVPEFIETGIACVERLHELGLTEFAFSEAESLLLGNWQDACAMSAQLHALPQDDLPWGDVYARVPASRRP